MRIATVAFPLLAAACAAPSPPSQPVPLPDPMATQARPAASSARPAVPVLANAGFESPFAPAGACPPRWGCSVHADGSSFRFAPDATTATEGRQSLLVERVGKEPWATVTQSFPAASLRGQRLRFSLAVRTGGVDGEGAGPWLLVLGDGRVLDHQVRRVQGTRDWQREVIELVLPGEAETLSVGATLEGGGRAWFDDARLEILGPATRR